MIVRIPADRPGAIVPEFATLAVIVPLPSSRPPATVIVFVVVPFRAEIVPPLLSRVIPAVCV